MQNNRGYYVELIVLSKKRTAVALDIQCLTIRTRILHARQKATICDKIAIYNNNLRSGLIKVHQLVTYTVSQLYVTLI